MPVTEAIILAGGLGTRLRQIIPNLPKAMAPVNGKPFLEYLMRYWKHQGITHFILSVGYKWEIIHDYFANRFEDVDLSYALEDKPLGTGGAFRFAINYLKRPGPYLLLNGDTHLKMDLNSFLEFHQMQQADITIAFNQHPAGAYLFANRYFPFPFNDFPISLENECLPKWRESLKVCHYEIDDIFTDIGTPQTYQSFSLT